MAGVGLLVPLSFGADCTLTFELPLLPTSSLSSGKGSAPFFKSAERFAEHGLSEVAAQYGHVELAHYLSDQADLYVGEEAAQAKHMAQMAKQQQEEKEFRAKKREEDKTATANLAAKVAARRGKPHVSKDALATSMAKKNAARARRLARISATDDDDGHAGTSQAPPVDSNSLEVSQTTLSLTTLSLLTESLRDDNDKLR